MLNVILRRVDESNAHGTSITKPCAKDPISHREKYINAKVFCWISFSFDVHASTFILNKQCISSFCLISALLALCHLRGSWLGFQSAGSLFLHTHLLFKYCVNISLLLLVIILYIDQWIIWLLTQERNKPF